MTLMLYATVSSGGIPAAMALEAPVRTKPIALYWMMAMVLGRQRQPVIGSHQTFLNFSSELLNRPTIAAVLKTKFSVTFKAMGLF